MTVPASVRLALPSEAVDIARLQRECWSRLPEGDELLSQVDESAAVEAWRLAIARPPLATLRVLVAVDPAPVGFAVTGPSDDPDSGPTDGLVAELVAPDLAGDHAARLVNAAIDTLRADGFQIAHMWLSSDDDAMRAFLTECGWAPDGAHREVGTESGLRRKMVRLHTDIR